MKIFLILVPVVVLSGCAFEPHISHDAPRNPQVLTVQNDGTMVMNNRTLNEKDVVIYPDGFGGERAAVKVRVPLKPDFYRDSIRVERETDAGELIP